MIAPDTVQQITGRIDIIDVVGAFVKLKRRGTNYLGLCPFHNEKSPSFTVSPSKEIFKCFGCGRSGNGISFVMEHEKLSYPEALRWLAQRYNVEIEETQASPEAVLKQQASESLHILNAFAQKHFEANLWETEGGKSVAQIYLHSRGLTDETLRKFGVGYAFPSGTDLSTAAKTGQWSNELLTKSGLAVERDGHLRDNYRDRIVFPIHSTSGKVIGFGARILVKNDKAPKYINTPETEVYVKSKILYGMFQARGPIDKAGECLLVEGYTDVLSLHQSGVENVVASGGTSLTPDQLRLIKKYTKNLTIVYDGDGAGIKAALRGLELALDEALNVQLVLLPEGEDPDSYAQKVGGEGFAAYLATNKVDFILFQIQTGLKEAGDDPIKKSALVSRIANTIARLDKTLDFTRQGSYIRQAAETLKIDEGGLTSLVNNSIRQRVSKIIADDEKSTAAKDAAKVSEGGSATPEEAELTDNAFELLYRSELQEREVVRVLLEHGMKRNEGALVGDYILSELPDEELFQSKTVLQLLQEYRNLLQQKGEVERSHFLYHANPEISTLTVSVLHFPYEQSKRWKEEGASNSGYQARLFQLPAQDFFRSVSPGGKDELSMYLNTQKDTSFEEVESALDYIKLRKIRMLLRQNSAELESANAADVSTLIATHRLLKDMEKEVTKKLGTVILH